MDVLVVLGHRLALPDDAEEVLDKDKRHPVALDAELLLAVAEDVSEVDVEQLAVLGDHDVVVVAVLDAHDVRGHRVAHTGHHEPLDALQVSEPGFSRLCPSLLLPRRRVAPYKFVEERRLQGLDRRAHLAALGLNLEDGRAVRHHPDHAQLKVLQFINRGRGTILPVGRTG